MKVGTIRICLVYKTCGKVQFFPIYEQREFSQKNLLVFGCFLVGDNPDSNIKAVGTHFALIMSKLRTPNDKSVNFRPY